MDKTLYDLMDWAGIEEIVYSEAANPGSLTPQIAKSLARLYFFVKFYDFPVAICGYM